jgi:hypothetical protein
VTHDPVPVTLGIRGAACVFARGSACLLEGAYRFRCEADRIVRPLDFVSPCTDACVAARACTIGAIVDYPWPATGLLNYTEENFMSFGDFLSGALNVVGEATGTSEIIGGAESLLGMGGSDGNGDSSALNGALNSALVSMTMGMSSAMGSAQNGFASELKKQKDDSDSDSDSDGDGSA